jgi:imidazolonepropionase-like amidohydrolase
MRDGARRHGGGAAARRLLLPARDPAAAGRALRAAGVPIAIATDHNPGSSPTLSPLLMLNMACTLFRLTPEEALRGMTVHGARALGLPTAAG